jgi:hypothetical protein
VAIIGRVYEAGVARAWRGEGDPETEVILVLTEQADLIETGLAHLNNQSLDRQTADEIVELHGHVARAISQSLGQGLPDLVRLEVPALSLPDSVNLR